MHEPDKADALFLLPTAWTPEEGLPTEARILGFWDALVPGISGTDTDTVCSHYGSGEQVSGSGCCTSTFGFTGKLNRLSYGSGSRIGPTGRDFGNSGACLRHYPTDLDSRPVGDTEYFLALSFVGESLI